MVSGAYDKNATFVQICQMAGIVIARERLGRNEEKFPVNHPFFVKLLK